MSFRLFAGMAMCVCLVSAPKSKGEGELNRQSFELIWQTLQTGYWDSTMGGVDWRAAHDKYAREAADADTTDAWRSAVQRMIHLLPSSHLAIVPGSLYRKPAAPGVKTNPGLQPIPGQSNDADEEDDTGLVGMDVERVEDLIVVTRVRPGLPAAAAGVRTGWIVEAVDAQDCAEALEYMRSQKEAGFAARLVSGWLRGNPSTHVSVVLRDGDGHRMEKTLTRIAAPEGTTAFGNLPPEAVEVEHRLLGDGVGYLRLSLFLDPLRVMPEVEKAITESRQAPGLILDLRNNPGGIGLMAMGIAGWFVEEQGLKLGTMKGREMTLNFVVNPRPAPFQGRVAILVNEGSASTSEILAQGFKDLGRGRVFGTKTAGAALPSVFISLPNGDRLQYPNANYTSAKGRVLEAQGVTPDVEVEPTIKALGGAGTWCWRQRSNGAEQNEAAGDSAVAGRVRLGRRHGQARRGSRHSGSLCRGDGRESGVSEDQRFGIGSDNYDCGPDDTRDDLSGA